MVQAGAPYDYHDCVDENAEPSWTNVIKDAVKEFVGAVAESSNQLASAAEKFAADSMHTIDEAAARAERSASSGADMAQIARRQLKTPASPRIAFRAPSMRRVSASEAKPATAPRFT